MNAPGAPARMYGTRTHVWPGRPAVGLAVVGLVVPGRVGARGVELAWGHVFKGSWWCVRVNE